jgi:hypothetical protein
VVKGARSMPRAERSGEPLSPSETPQPAQPLPPTSLTSSRLSPSHTPLSRAGGLGPEPAGRVFGGGGASRPADAMKKLRIVMLGFGTARQKMVLE